MNPSILGFFITGTDTEIGKTWITTLLILGLRRQGISCCPIKPIASGGIMYERNRISEDAVFYQQKTGINEPLSILNPFCLQRPASPHFAAESEGKSIPIPDLLQSIQQLSLRYTAVLVEGIGGWLVPITYDYCVADFAKALQLPVMVVSANRLGTINHTLLTLASIRSYGIEPTGVILTKLTPGELTDLEINNIETIEQIGTVKILGNIPYLPPNLWTENHREQLWNTIKETIQWETLIRILHIQ